MVFILVVFAISKPGPGTEAASHVRERRLCFQDVPKMFPSINGILMSTSKNLRASHLK